MLAALLYASVIIANKFLKGLTGLETTITQLATASLVLLPYVLITDNFHKKPDGMSLLILLTLGILHTGIAYLLYFTLIQKMNVQTVAVFSYMDPISAIVMSSIFLNEKMSFLQIAGGILILGSTFVSENYQKINSGRIKRN